MEWAGDDVIITIRPGHTSYVGRYLVVDRSGGNMSWIRAGDVRLFCSQDRAGVPGESAVGATDSPRRSLLIFSTSHPEIFRMQIDQ